MEGICYLKIGHLIWKCGEEFFCYSKNYVFPETVIIKRQKCNYLGLFLCSGIFRTPYKHLPEEHTAVGMPEKIRLFGEKATDNLTRCLGL